MFTQIKHLLQEEAGNTDPISPATPQQQPPAEPAAPVGGEPNPPASPPANDADDFDTKFQNRLFEIAKEKGFEVQSIEDVFKKPEPIEIIKNPYEKIDPKVKSFLDYHAETNRSYEDYLALQTDVTTIPDIELARDRVRQETGQTLSNEEIDRYLEKKLNVDLSDLADLDVADRIELSAFAKSAREAKIAEQQKYKQPLEPAKPSGGENASDMVELENGEKMPKEVYEKMVKNRQAYVEGIKASVDSIAQSQFEFKIDDNGSEKSIAVNYEYAAEDKQKMLLRAEDLEKTIKTLFKNDKNEFNHADLTESMFWLDKKDRESAISKLLHKARAEGIESVLKDRHNPNFTGGLPNIPGSKKPAPSGNVQTGGFGVKIPFTNIPKN